MAAPLVLALGACAGDPEPGTFGLVEGFAGLVAADEPNAAMIGREILAQNGTAADAAVAMGFALGVTLPSRAGLAGGGACLVFDKQNRRGEALVFTPSAPAGEVPAPATPRGLALLHARYGVMRWELLLAPAEELARFGAPLSRALASDVKRAAARIDGEPSLARLFRRTDGRLLEEGGRLEQPELSALLSGIRLRGGGYLHGGGLPERLAEAAAAVGQRLPAERVREKRATLGAPLTLALGSDRLYLPPPPTSGGLLVERLWRALAADWPDEAAAQQRRFAAAAADLAEPDETAGAGFVVGDRFGNAVACGFTMNGLFGLGKVAPGTGLLLAAAPAAAGQGVPIALALVGNENTAKARFAASAGTGRPAAAALAQVLLRLYADDPRTPLEAAVAGPRLAPAAESARIVAFECPDGLLERDRRDCTALADPRGHGLAEIAR